MPLLFRRLHRRSLLQRPASGNGSSRLFSGVLPLGSEAASGRAEDRDLSHTADKGPSVVFLDELDDPRVIHGVMDA